MYYGSGTEELQRIQRDNDVTRARPDSGQPADAAAYAADRTDVSMAAIFKVWRHPKNPTPYIDAYFLEEQSCHI